MYAGLGSSLISIFPYVGFKMATFDILKTALNVQRSDPNFTMMNVIIGGISGFITIFICYPSDLIRRRM